MMVDLQRLGSFFKYTFERYVYTDAGDFPPFFFIFAYNFTHVHSIFPSPSLNSKDLLQTDLEYPFSNSGDSDSVSDSVSDSDSKF